MSDLRLEALTAAEQAQVVHQQLKSLEADYLSKSLMLESMAGAPPGPDNKGYAENLAREVDTIRHAIEVHRGKLHELRGAPDGGEG